MSSVVPPPLTAAFADRYLLERELGRGGMATVYLGHDRKHDRRVAIKVLHSDFASFGGSGRFLREIGITARLQHPHILTLIDSGEIELPGESTRALFYVMPYVEEESLQQRIRREGALPWKEAVRLLREIADALAYAHRTGIVHRDIKPANVMLSGEHALVVDFGIAKAVGEAAPGDALTGTGITLGTPEYMAPEQALGDAPDHRCDIYAVGVLAYEMLTGGPPFSGTPRAVLSAHITRSAPAIRAGRPEVPPELSAVVERCMAKDPAERFGTADELVAALDAIVAPPQAASSRRRPIARAGIATAVLVLVLGLTAMLARERRQRWVHAEAMPSIQQFIAAGEFDSAFAVARRAQGRRGADEPLAPLWRYMSYGFVFTTEPPGARVYRAAFDDTTRWEYLGTTSTDTIRVPRAMGRYRFEREGYHPRVLLAGGDLLGDQLEFALGGASMPPLVRLSALDHPHREMVYVGGPVVRVPGVVTGGTELAEFLIDRHEVTNREYLAFVQAGGYQRREFWTEEFIRDGRRLSWEEAIRLFVDATGRPGPATWAGGAPRPGQEDLPVGGVSWYEAAAYARFAGKQLPTVAHWQTAAGRSAAGFVLPGSNFESDGPRPGSRHAGMSPWGTFDMAGNVREWCLNAGDGEHRYILGGGWSEAPFRFTDDVTQPAFDRAPINGIRLAIYPLDDPLLEAATGRVQRPFRDYDRERPVPDAEFERLRVVFDYDPLPLEALVEESDSSHADWIRERVTFTAAYRGEGVTAILFLPRRHEPPFQTVIFFPGSNALFERSSDVIDGQQFAWLLRNGRAVVYPVYRGMLERSDGTPIVTSATIAYRDAVVAWGQDLRRTVDYLQTRSGIDATRLAFFGHSLGGRLGGVMMGIEPRLKAGVLLVAGLSPLPARPEVDPINYLPRIRIPVLMLNGRYDDVFRYESSQRPFFRLLGTPAEHKRHLVYDDVHSVPQVELIREGLGWLDRYLGPVRTRAAP